MRDQVVLNVLSKVGGVLVNGVGAAAGELHPLSHNDELSVGQVPLRVEVFEAAPVQKVRVQVQQGLLGCGVDGGGGVICTWRG